MAKAKRPYCAFDIECYTNYFLVKFKTLDGRVREFELHEDCPQIDREGIKKIIANWTLVSFNGNSYDKWMLFYALKGATNQELKTLSDDIILNDDMKTWMIGERYGITIYPYFDHIDLIEVAPGMHGLKTYIGRMFCKKMQDLPIEPHELITPAQRPLLRDYCGNDVGGTIDLFKELGERIAIRENMTAKYGIDLRSKSDAQIAEAVIKAHIEKVTGNRLERPRLPGGYSFKYVAPSFIKLKSSVLRDLLKTATTISFTLDKNGSPILPKEFEESTITIGNGSYNMQIGGLHSTEECTAHFSDDEYVLCDSDVASYYPNIILNCKLFPKHLGPVFLAVYRSIVVERLAAKDAAKRLRKEIAKCKNEAEIERLERLYDEQIALDKMFKICINGLFGKFGSKWSVVYSPDLLLQTTITGQLALLMLIERFEAAGIPVVSANTDGIVTKCPVGKIAVRDAIIVEWEFDTSFDMEHTEYKMLASRDVNSYIAIKPNGEVKQKGAYAFVGSTGQRIEKNPQAYIAIDAVIANLRDGTPIEKTVRECRDPRRFVVVKKVNGGAMYGADVKSWKEPYRDTAGKLKYQAKRSAEGGDYLGKVVRWAYAKNETRYISYKTNGNKVGGSDGCRPLMELPDDLPDWIDHQWYINRAHAIIGEIGVL